PRDRIELLKRHNCIKFFKSLPERIFGRRKFFANPGDGKQPAIETQQGRSWYISIVQSCPPMLKNKLRQCICVCTKNWFKCPKVRCLPEFALKFTKIIYAVSRPQHLLQQIAGGSVRIIDQRGEQILEEVLRGTLWQFYKLVSVKNICRLRSDGDIVEPRICRTDAATKRIAQPLLTEIPGHFFAHSLCPQPLVEECFFAARQSKHLLS